MMIRMFHIACDAPDHDVSSSYDLGDSYYAADARQLARDEGFHMRGDMAICPTCWEAGVRYPEVAAFNAKYALPPVGVSFA